MRTYDLKLLVVILMLAAFVRVSGAFEWQGYFFDEGVHVPSALSLMQYGTSTQGHWRHPPLGNLLLCGSIKLFGNNPYGWRIVGIVFGTATVALLYAFARKLFPTGPAPLFASCIMALDPFHAYYSRILMMEIPVTFFFLVFLYFLISYVQNHSIAHLCFSGVALGLTVATKGAYFVISILLILCYALYMAYCHEDNPKKIVVDFFVMLVILPVAIYILSYVIWFGRGYTFFEFINMQMDAASDIRNATESSFKAIKLLRLGGLPWEWFIKPISYGFQFGGDAGNKRFILEINNPPIRMLVLPSIAFLFYSGWKQKQLSEFIVPLLFCSSYALLLMVNRPIFSYSSLVLLPFAYLSVSRMIEQFAIWRGKQVIVLVLFLTCLLLWGAYTFPLYSSISVPPALYQPILTITNYVDVLNL